MMGAIVTWQDSVSNAQSLTDAVRRLCSHLNEHGIRDLAYGYMVEAQSYIRHDVVMVTTVPDELMRVYYKHGAFDFDPVADRVGDSKKPFLVDLESLYRGHGSEKFRGQVTMRAFIDRNYRFFWSFPFADIELLGFGALTMHLQPGKTPDSCDLNYLGDLSNEFHHIVKAQGLMADCFELSELETSTLQSTMRGQTAAAIAASDGVSSRTIEHRLQSVREKLKANTTSEAVFKAIAYGIIKNR